MQTDFAHTFTVEVGGSYGNYPPGTPLENTEYIAHFMGLAGYQVANVGLNEARFGFDFIKEKGEETGVTYVSANLVPTGKKKPELDPFVVRSVGGLRVGFLGVLDAVTPVPPEMVEQGVEVLDPIETVAEWVPKVRKKADFVVVLGYLYGNRAEELAQRVEGIDLILHRGSRITAAPSRVGNTVLASAGRLSGNVAELELTFAPSGSLETFVGDVVQLRESSPRDRDMLAEVDEILNRQVRELRSRQAAAAVQAAEEREEETPAHQDEASPEEATEPNPQEQTLRHKAQASLAGWHPPVTGDISLFAGTASCRACHESVVTAWEAGAHAQAFATLAATEDWNSADCLPCHTSGFAAYARVEQGLPAPEFWNVQCEACHGPGAAHAADPATKMGPVAAATCTACHTPEWTPAFEDAKARAALSHGH